MNASHCCCLRRVHEKKSRSRPTLTSPRLRPALLHEHSAAPHTSQHHSIARPSDSPSITFKMAVFPSRKFRSTNDSSLAARYRLLLAKHPFALFGLPFIATMLLGSFFLTPATALRYERHDRKVRQMTKDEELGIGQNKRKIDLREEYYVSTPAIVPVRYGGSQDVLLLSVIKWLELTGPILRRNLQRKIWMIGSRNGSRGCPVSMTECFEWIATLQA